MPNALPNSGDEVIACAFCHGTGKDPFALLSPLSTCQTCEGKGKVTVRAPYVKCGECDGKGVQPHHRLTCSACDGRGVQTVPQNNRVCPECKGTGLAPGSEIDLGCALCNGSGRVAVGKAAAK